MLFGAGLDGSFELDHDYVAGKRFASGDAVVLDAISIGRVYYADMARTAIVGEPACRRPWTPVLFELGMVALPW